MPFNEESLRALQRLVEELDSDRSLNEPDRLRRRSEALDRLDVYLPDGSIPAFDAGFAGEELYHRASAVYASLEAVNCELYQRIRRDIQRGDGRNSLRVWVEKSSQDARAARLVNGDGYDSLDELISGVLQFEEPDHGVSAGAEMVFYQPTPARHIFDLLDRTALTERDVLIDLGSGLGHVPLLVSICSNARSIGIELERAYVECARRSAQSLHLSTVTFLQQDARAANLSSGTVFYLYTPFTGTILRAVLDALRREAAARTIRVCTFGPCTPVVAEEPWLVPVGALEPDRIAIFRSHR